jgi:hypothetical protein
MIIGQYLRMLSFHLAVNARCVEVTSRFGEVKPRCFQNSETLFQSRSHQCWLSTPRVSTWSIRSQWVDRIQRTL